MADGAKIGLASGGILLCESSNMKSKCETETTTRITTSTQINPLPVESPLVDFTTIEPVSISKITKISEFQTNPNHLKSFLQTKSQKGFYNSANRV